jgi:glycine betaine/proline transport system ATP-binding protein
MRDGRVVQLGTPEEIVGSPADDYVREFVRDVPREQVMTVRRAMRAASAQEAGEGPALSPEATVSQAIEAVARSGQTARVVDRGRCLGVVDSDALLEVVAGTDGQSTQPATEPAAEPVSATAGPADPAHRGSPGPAHDGSAGPAREGVA